MTDVLTEIATKATVPEMSIVFSTGGDPFTVTAVDGDEDRPRGAQRVRIDCGPFSLFLTRDSVPALVQALILA